MGKIKKVATSKHDASVSPAFSIFIQTVSTAPLSELPSHLASLPRRWPFPRGDLYHWIGPLNRFDDILENFSSRYGLKDGPQSVAFGMSQLLEGSEGTDEPKLRQLGFSQEGDRELVESILDFSRLLLEKCGNRSLYNSSDRLNELLNSTSLSLVHGTLRIALCLAQRYRDRLRSGHFQFPPLSTHYNLDVVRLEKLAQPIPIPPQPSTKKPTSTSPVKTAKGKEKAGRSRQRRSSTSVSPNDFRSLCKEGVQEFQYESQAWEDWAQVELKFPTAEASKSSADGAGDASPSQNHSGPSSPTPTRRQSSAAGSRLSRLSTVDDLNGHAETPAEGTPKSASAEYFCPPISTVLHSPLEATITSWLAAVPSSLHYELLHKLRVARGLATSGATRMHVLAIRLLAVANLAYVLPDSTFQQKLFGQDRDPGQRQLLVRQTADLLHAGSSEVNQIPLTIQSHALETLGALTKQKSMTTDLSATLSITANHGTLLFVVQKGLTDLAEDHDVTDSVDGDDWRDNLFSLLRLMMDASPHASRNSDAFASPALMSCYVEVLNTHTEKAQRLYLKVLEFLESFTHHIKDGLATLLNNKTFEAVTELLSHLVSSALEQVRLDQGFQAAYRTPSIDYRIPYLQQQSIRAILSFINGVNGHQGGPADRVLRSLIDSHKLLDAFRLIIQNAATFGAHTWSEVVKAMNSFLHNEPTSYTVIAEAGLSKSFLQSITLRDASTSSATNGGSSSHNLISQVEESETAPALGQTPLESTPRHSSNTVSPDVGHVPLGILPAAEAISNASQAFGALCLTASGFELFGNSGALETFFGVFVSAPHVKVMNDPNLLAILGSTFDELVRHHPGMRSDVLTMVLVTLARVRHLCRSMARRHGAGAKLWVDDSHGGLSVAGGNSSLLGDEVLGSSAGTVLDLPNGKKLMSGGLTDSGPVSDSMIPEEKDENGLAVADYMTPIVGFLMSFFENQSLCSSFIDAGGVEFVLDLATMPSLPFDFFRANAHIGTSHDVAQVIHMMAETKPHLVLPSLLNRALGACQHLEPFAGEQPNDVTCYFAPLTKRPRDATDIMDTESSDMVRQNGTRLAKALTSLHFLTTILTEAFESPIYSTRSPQPSLFTQANLADMYANLCLKLGAISAACIREEIALQKNAPEAWEEATRPKDFETGNDDVDQIFGLDPARDQASRENDAAHVLASLFDPQERQSESTEQRTESPEEARSSTNVENGSRLSAEGLATDKKTAAFKNVVVLRYLLMQLPTSITHFTSLLGRGLIMKRRVDTVQKQNTFAVADAIAEALIIQLDPEFLRSAEAFQTRQQFLEMRFSYLVVVLFNLYHVILDMSPTADFKQCITSVVMSFKKRGGLRMLKNIGEEFFTELKSCEVSDQTIRSMTAANSGLKVTLDIFDYLTSAKCIVDSAQSNALKNPDRARPYYFVPSQLLLELRVEALPLARTIWDSEYADQASKAVVEKLVAILRHVLNGEQEDGAHHDGDDARSVISPPYKRFQVAVAHLDALTAQGFDEGLAREALFRCHNNPPLAEDYCKAYTRDPARQRNPIPNHELESTVPHTPEAPSRHGSAIHSVRNVESRSSPAPQMNADLNPDLVEMLRTSIERVRNNHDELTDPVPTNQPGSAGSDVPISGVSANAMSIDNLLNESPNTGNEQTSAIAQPEIPVSTVNETRYTIESLDSQRSSIREDLTERCLNVLNNHHDVTFVLSELLLSATRKLDPDEAIEFRESASNMVVMSLISLQTEETSQSEVKKVAAYSHFTALLLQDKDMYDTSLEELQSNFDDLLGFVKIPSTQPSVESPIGHVLLIFEKMLSDDAEPRKIQWTPPTSLDAPIASIPPSEKEPVLTLEQKRQLFDTVLEALPRVGKEKSLALSIARVLVILTRQREIAVLLGEKRNIGRLFLMIKQLANGVDDRLQSALLLILRHVIEDDDTLRQIMRSEIVANFDTRNPRQNDTTGYVRQMWHLVLRSPTIFIEITNEKLKLHRFDLHPRPQTLVLKTDGIDGVPQDVSTSRPIETTEPSADGDPSIEKEKAVTGLDNNEKLKAGEVRPPVVEHPDGVIHFLLSELLAYKDVEDKEAAAEGAVEKASWNTPNDLDIAMDTGNVSDAASDVDGPVPRVRPASEKQPFKGEDHPIYIYRCFLLQCLMELLHSYNRTKIEFINFSRKADPLAMTPSKPRSGVLNYLLNALVPTGALEPDDSSVSFRKRTITSDWAMRVIVALCSKTGELGLLPSLNQRYTSYQRVADNDDEPDLSFVRRFVLEHALKAFKDANNSSESLQVKYARMLCLADLFHKMLSKPSGSDGTAGSNNNSHKTLSRMMFEKNFIAALTTSLAEVDLAFPGSKRVVKHILKPLNELTETAYHLSVTSSSSIASALGTSEDDIISSASSVSEVEDEREETPDLFRNSTLGMLEPNRRDDSSSESGEDDEMYEDEYADEMEFEEGMGNVDPNDGEVVSDEDVDEDLGGPGPMEGLSGDVPMDIELVMDDPHMDVDTDEDDDGEDDDEDEDDSDDDDDDDDEDGEDFIIEADDAIMEGEINGDNENDSLENGEGGEDEWHSEDDEENGFDEVNDEDDSHEGLEEVLDRSNVVALGAGGETSGHEQLNNLLQILGENPNDAGDGPVHRQTALLAEGHGMDEDMPVDEDGEDEDPDELDENEEDMTYQTFNDMLNNDMLNDPDTPWPWDEAPPFLQGHHRHIRTGPGQLGSFLSRQITSHGMPAPNIHGGRAHRHAGPVRATDDGTNPLLQRPGATMPTASTSGFASSGISAPNEFVAAVDSFNPGFTALFAPGSGHGGVLDAIMEAVHRGDGRVEMTNRRGQFDIRVNASPQQFREFLRPPPYPSSFPRSSREDPHRAVSFTASMTITRWQEEARLLYGNNHVDKTQYVVTALLSVLIPPAIEEEKARIKKAEEDRKREEEERVERERLDRIKREEAEKAQKAEDEREAAAKAEAELAAAEEAAAEAREAAQTQEPGSEATDAPEPMEDVQATSPEEAPVTQTGEPSASTEGQPVSSQTGPRAYTTIRGRRLDITDLSIDAEFLEGLPEELREEVIMQQYAERRQQAVEQGQPSSEISAEFLAALPEDIREELLQQDAQDRRRREREAARRQAATEAGGQPRAEEMDADSFMATLDPSLRRSILAEQSDDILQQLAPEYAAEARAIISRQLHHYGRLPPGREAREDRGLQEASTSKEPRKQVVQMVDKAGVATLMRLMFMPQQGSARQNLYRVLQNVCGHRQTRTEVISFLLLILKDGSADVSAVERSLALLSLRAKAPASQKTPQPAKKSLSLQAGVAANEEMTPLMVVQQCLGALSSLTQYNAHVASVFLRELESVSSVKSKTGRKGKGKETRASKFALNDLISLLDRKLITDNSSCMESLAALLATITAPLIWLLKKEKPTEVPEAEATAAAPTDEADATRAQIEPGTDMATSNVEVVEVEPISPTAPFMEAGAAAGVEIAVNNIPTAGPVSVSASGSATDAVGSASQSAEAVSAQEEDRAKKIFDPPVVPDYNLRLVIGILSARECNAKTFRDAVTTITNLSLIPDAREVFGKELVSQAQILSQSILSDLDELLPSIRDAKSGTDIQGIATSKFSPASSDQAKLLRVLTALDYIFDPKRPENKGKVEKDTSPPSEILTSLYESPTFFPLWSKLSRCLGAMREGDSMLSAATILLPLIESLMLVCKNTSLKDAPLARQMREQSVTTPPPETANNLETLFFNFTTEHRKILNELVRQNSKLMSGSFSLLVKNPKVLEFDNKRAYFNRQIHSRQREARHPQPPLQLSVRRDQVFLDSFKSLYFKSADEMKYGKLSIRFHGEEGVDAGGVSREWFQVLARGMFNPNYALFTPVASDKTTFHPNRLSGVNQEHLMFFKFIGRIIGKALFENRVLDCHFSRAVYKRIMGKTISIKDMESLDPDYYKSLEWILHNDVSEILTETMSTESEDFGERRIIDLVENGRNIPVTEENKQEYVQLVSEYRLTGSVSDQLENFLKGFNDIIPAELISIFNEQELEFLISGLPNVDVDDWKANTEYHNYTASSQQIQWFWRAVKSWNGEEVAKLLQFSTGSSKVPLEGMGQLEGMNGITKFNIHKDYGSKDRLPSSHTCFNQLDLPEYESYEALKKALYTAMTQGNEYFGFA